MSNLGLELALNELGLRLHRAKVGDRYVLERLLAENLMLGGESSGHILCLDKTTTGDGVITALQVLAVLVQSGDSLHVLKAGMHKFPQLMINVPLVHKIDLGGYPIIHNAVRAAEMQLGRKGRVLLRPSGTEPVVRVMVEGRDAGEVNRLAHDIAAIVGAAVSA